MVAWVFIEPLCFPVEDVAEAISDMSTHSCVTRAGAFRSPLRERLDRQPVAVSKFAAAQPPFVGVAADDVRSFPLAINAVLHERKPARIPL